VAKEGSDCFEAHASVDGLGCKGVTELVWVHMTADRPTNSIWASVPRNRSRSPAADPTIRSINSVA
jgi:hypothetical protein